MVKNVLGSAAGIFQGVGEDGHAVEGTVVVDGPGEGCDCGGQPPPGSSAAGMVAIVSWAFASMLYHSNTQDDCPAAFLKM